MNESEQVDTDAEAKDLENKCQEPHRCPQDSLLCSQVMDLTDLSVKPEKLQGSGFAHQLPTGSRLFHIWTLLYRIAREMAPMM